MTDPKAIGGRRDTVSNEKYPQVRKDLALTYKVVRDDEATHQVVPLGGIHLYRDEQTVERIAEWLHDYDQNGAKDGDPWEREDDYLRGAYRDFANDLLDALAAAEGET